MNIIYVTIFNRVICKTPLQKSTKFYAVLKRFGKKKNGWKCEFDTFKYMGVGKLCTSIKNTSESASIYGDFGAWAQV